MNTQTRTSLHEIAEELYQTQPGVNQAATDFQKASNQLQNAWLLNRPAQLRRAALDAAAAAITLHEMTDAQLLETPAETNP